MNLDLTQPRATAESTFTDSCVIVRDNGGVYDDILDPTTLRLIRPADDERTIYAGACSVTPEQNLAQPAVEGGDARSIVRYVVKIPVAAARVEPGDVVLVAAEDPALDDQVLRVVSIDQRTRAVTRRLHCELRQRVRDRP